MTVTASQVRGSAEHAPVHLQGQDKGRKNVKREIDYFQRPFECLIF
jgi:hypothetical protein